MPFYDKKGLTNEQIEMISAWIQQGAPNIFGEIPERSCTPPAILKHHLFGVEAGGKKNALNDKILNELGEPIATKVDTTNQLLQLLFDIKNAQFTCPEDQVEGYEIVLYRDIEYKQAIKSYQCKLYFSRSYIEAFIPVNDLKKEKFFYFRIENTSLNKFAFPNLNTLEHIRYQWALSRQ